MEDCWPLVPTIFTISSSGRNAGAAKYSAVGAVSEKPNEAKANKLLLLLYGNFVLIHEKIGIWKGWSS